LDRKGQGTSGRNTPLARPVRNAMGFGCLTGCG
jgi:hypothetical protein